MAGNAFAVHACRVRSLERVVAVNMRRAHGMSRVMSQNAIIIYASYVTTVHKRTRVRAAGLVWFRAHRRRQIRRGVG